MHKGDRSDIKIELLRESAEFVANSAFQLLRMDPLLIGIYLTVGGYLTNVSLEIQRQIGSSVYMLGLCNIFTYVYVFWIFYV